MSALQNVLWVDCTAGALAGIAMLSLAHWLSGWYGLPVELLRFNGLVNLAYGSFSFSLAVRRRRPLWMIVLLAAGNAAWFFVCMAMAVRFSPTASGFGLATLVGEGLFVAALACIEWTQRHRLTNLY